MMKELHIEKEANIKYWRALYVNSRAEKKVMETLLQKNIEAYAPVIKTMRQWSDRKKMVELPLLNGYVFVHVDSEQNDKVLQTKGVVSYVRSEGKIALVRDVEIMRLKQIADLDYEVEVGIARKEYKEGDKIKITSGPLKNIEGFVLESIKGRFIEIVIESLGQSIRVKLPPDLIGLQNKN